jgi:hypothetical protein
MAAAPMPEKRGRPKKKAQDLTADEVMRKLFPKEVADKAKEEAEKNRRKPS